MNIELRSISHNERLSEETNAYSAKLFVDGKHFADVSNHGTGGCDNQYPAKGVTRAELDALNDKIKAEYPPVELGNGLGSVPCDLELLCGQLLDRYLSIRDVRKACGRMVTFYLDGDVTKNGAFRTMKPKGHRGALPAEWVAKAKAHVSAKYGATVHFVGDLTDDQIWELVK